MRSWSDFVDWAMGQEAASGGRLALRRRWESLRALAEVVIAKLPPGEVEALLGRPVHLLDPENNDLKALVAYGIGRGFLKDPSLLQAALEDDRRADPLHFLAQHSGKTFGEKYAPLFAEYWLKSPADGWAKQSSKGLYDLLWSPTELPGKSIRIELKASSERPEFRFQQIRHPRLSGGKDPDYDLLLCLGVSAGALEWWALPAAALDNFADNDAVVADDIIITRHHGKRQPIWNETRGFTDEGWFAATKKARGLLAKYSCAESTDLREKILSLV